MNNYQTKTDILAQSNCLTLGELIDKLNDCEDKDISIVLYDIDGVRPFNLYVNDETSIIMNVGMYGDGDKVTVNELITDCHELINKTGNDTNSFVLVSALLTTPYTIVTDVVDTLHGCILRTEFLEGLLC